MQIEIDSQSGFCFGVVTAIKKAEAELDANGKLYCLGDIVHNNHEVARLSQRGLITINREQFLALHNAKVLLRAHGEPPETYEIAKRNNIEIIDATCPVVLQLQKKIKKAWKSQEKEQGQIVIYGKTGHAEVNGLVGQTNGKAIVVEKIADLNKISTHIPLYLYAQTTQSIAGYQTIISALEKRNTGALHYEDTICRQVSNRMPNIRQFAARHDVILFVSGTKSSNGKVLYEESLKVNPRSHFISEIDSLQIEWIKNAESIGICGATSTPLWLMQKVAERCNDLIKKGE